MFFEILQTVSWFFSSLPDFCKDIAAISLLFLPAAVFAAAAIVYAAAKKLRIRSKNWYFFFSQGCYLLFAAFSLLSVRGEVVIFCIAAALAAEAVSLGFYGVLCLFTGRRGEKKPKKKKVQPSAQEYFEETFPAPLETAAESKPKIVRCFSGVGEEEPPALRSLDDVRFDYVFSVFERLREMKLGAGDRLETEKMGELLEIYKNKGALSGEECETLNDILASLLKMMAKYDV